MCSVVPKTAVSLLLMLTLAVHAPVSAAPVFTLLPALSPNGRAVSTAISADGSTVVGTGSTALGDRGYRWRVDGSMETVHIPNAATSAANAVNADGSVVVGGSTFSNGSSGAIRWTNGVGTVRLSESPAAPFGSATGVSADGSIVVGNGAAGSVRWTAAGGSTLLGLPADVTGALASGISADGSVIVGQENSTTSNYRPLRWTSAGVTSIGPGDYVLGTPAVSSDGHVIAGVDFVSQSRPKPYFWTSSMGMQFLPELAGSSFSIPTSINSDGSLVGGYAAFGPSGFRACLWNTSGSVLDLTTYLPTIGIDLTGWVRLFKVTGISADGRSLTGIGGLVNGDVRAWHIRDLPAPSGASLLFLAGLLSHRRVRSSENGH